MENAISEILWEIENTWFEVLEYQFRRDTAKADNDIETFEKTSVSHDAYLFHHHCVVQLAYRCGISRSDIEVAIAKANQYFHVCHTPGLSGL